MADPSSGQAPLTVSFDATASSDPDGAPLQYAWDLDGDGELDDAFTPTATHTYSVPGSHTVRLRVEDGHGAIDEETVTIDVRADANQAPTAHIDAPTSTTTWAVGDTVTLQGGGADPEGGALEHRWDLGVVHCSATPPFDCHTHPLETRSGATASFSAPDHDYPSRLSVTLTVTDAGGLSDTETLEILPRTRTLTVDTVPDGLQAFVGGSAVPEGQPQMVIERSTQTFSVPSPQVMGHQHLPARRLGRRRRLAEPDDDRDGRPVVHRAVQRPAAGPGDRQSRDGARPPCRSSSRQPAPSTRRACR